VPRRRRPKASRVVPDERWYQKAVFYELSVRGFNDGNDDGFGDFKGLIDKLD
jgi:maltose alpha-D-glucosyltransferase/alpha-amylase